MNYTKTIVCLANSRKHSGRCIAGREVITNGHVGVSSNNSRSYRLQGERIAYVEIEKPLTVGEQIRNNST